MFPLLFLVPIYPTEVITKLQLKDVYVTTGIFSKVENGYNNPSVDMLIALTEIFECDFNEFFKK